MKRSLLSFLLSGCIGISLAQSSKSRLEKDYQDYPYWVEMMQDPKANFFETQKAFNTYWKDRKIQKGGGYKPFKRWEYFMSLQVDAKGNKPQPAQINEEIQATQNSINPELSSSGWQEVGPVALPTNGTGQPNGLGRINAIAFHPTDSNTFYVGAPVGGLWKTTDGGAHWSSNTDGLATLGVSSIVVDKNDPNTVYFGSGDRDGGDSPGLGVYKSTDGGNTWALSNAGMGNRTVCALIQDPNNTNVLIAASTAAIYRSTDGGANWTNIQYGNFKDIKFHPTNPSIVYAASGGNLYKSTNNGVSFALAMNGIPTGKSRLVIGTTPDSPNTVYVLSSQGSVFGGLFKSTDSGVSFTTQSTTPNIMDYSYMGNGTSGQAWYDMCIAVNPDNVNEIYVGGINVFKSVDGGVTWNISAHWVGNSNIDGIHADQHAIEYSPTGKLYTGNDGGIYHKGRSNEDWTDISSGLAISQCYKIGQSQTDVNKVIVGYQDNGTGIFDNGDWRTEIGGDGMEAIIDYTDANFMYGELYRGNIRRSTNGGYSFYNIAGYGINGINETGAWVTPYVLHETDPNTMFAGYEDIWRTNTVKANVVWTAISNNLGGTAKFSVLEHNESNGDILYAAKGSTLYRSDNVMDASVTWNTVSMPGSGNVLSIETSELDENIVYVSRGFKIYESSDKGANWTDITGNISNYQYKSSLVYANMAIGRGLYVATDYGVFFKPENETDWINYTAGLPAYSKIKEIEIYEDPNGDNHKIRAASYGRGLWSNDIYITNTPHVSVADTLLTICSGASVNLTASDAVSYFWKDASGTVIGSTASISVTPSSSTNYTAYGIMSSGDTTSVNVVVNVESVSLTITGSITVCEGEDVILSVSGANSYIWSGGVTSTSHSVQFTPTGNTTVQVTGTSASGCESSETINITVLPKPVVLTTNDNSACEGESVTITASGSNSYLWSTGETTPSIVVNSASGINSVWVIGQTNGCSSDTVTNALTWIASPIVSISGDLEVCAGDMVTLTATGADSYVWSTGETTPIISFTASTDSTVSVSGISNGCSSAVIGATVAVQAYPVLNVTGNTQVCIGEVVTLTASGANDYTWSVANSSVDSHILEYTATVDTVITLTGTSTFGCEVSQNISIQVSSHPITTVSTDNSACIGESITITASGSDTYTWSTGETTASIVIPSTSNLNSVWVIGQSNGCLSDTVTNALTWIANPVVNVAGNTTICAGEQVTLTASGADTYLWSTGETTTSISFIAHTDSVVYVTGTTNGCSSASISVPVSVQAHPVLALSGNGAYCEGEVITLSASGADTYLWSTGETTASISFVASTDTIVSVTGTTNGCSSNANLSATVNANPIVSVSGNTTVCEGESITLTASGADSYLWSNGETTATIVLSDATGLENSTISVVGSSQGCSSINVNTVLLWKNNPTVIVGGSKNICIGESVTLTANGAESYLWSNGETTSSITFTPSSDTTLTVSGTSNGCSSDVVSSTILVSPNPIVLITGNSNVCEGELVTLTASGAATYSWSNGQTGHSIQFNATSSETITVTGTTGICSSTEQINVVVEPTPVVMINGETQVCSDEMITLTASGADSYLWSNGETTSSVTIAIPADTNSLDISVVGTTNNCASAEVGTVLSWLINPIVVINGETELCEGQSTTLTASGADSYLWSTGETTASITYTSTVGDSIISVEGFKDGCSSTIASTTITVNPQPSVTITGSTLVCEGDVVTLTASGADSYLWSTGETTTSINVTASQSETISVTGTSLNCTDMNSVQLTVNPTPTVLVSGNTSACEGESIVLTASGADSYLWSTGETTASITVTDINSSVNVVGTTNGCNSESINTSLIWTTNPVVVVSGNTTICEGESVTLTASGATSYLWSTGATTASITLSPSSNVSVSVTGTSNGCSDVVTSNIVVNENPVVTISGNNVVCLGDLVQLTASGANTYSWPNGSTNTTVEFTATADTIVQVTGISTDGCSTVSNLSITVNPIPVVAITGNNNACVGNSITLTASGASTYLWSTGATTASITISDTAVHNVSVIGTTLSCSSESVNTNLSWINNPEVSISSPSNVCSGDMIIMTASGANSYLWSTGETTATISMLASSDTVVSVIGTSNGCSSTEVSKAINVNQTPNIHVNGITTVCAGEMVTLIASQAGNYTWSNGMVGDTIQFIATVNETITVQGTLNGCDDSETVSIIVNAIPTVGITGNHTVCNGESVTLTANGNTTGGSYLWSTGATTASITLSPLVDETVTVVYTLNGCSSNEASHSITVNPTPVVTISGGLVTCSGNSVTLTASGADTYLWSTGETTASITVSPTSSTDVSVTGTTNGCESSLVTANIVVNAATPVTISGNTTVCTGETTILTASGSGPYLWSTGETTASISVTPTANETISVVSSANGCSSNAQVSLTVSTGPNVQITGNLEGCVGEVVELVATGADSYLWSTGATTPSINVTITGAMNISVSGTTGGCTATETAQLSITSNASYFVVEIQTDEYGYETTWKLEDGQGNTVASHTIGADGYLDNFATYYDTVHCALVGDCYTFTIYDDYGDGICCEYGNGLYKVVQDDGTVLAQGASFGASESKSFCIGSGALYGVSLSAYNMTVCPNEAFSVTASGADSYMWLNSDGDLIWESATLLSSSTESTSYTVLGIIGNDTNAVDFALEVKELNVQISGPTEICEGDKVWLQVTGARHFEWSNGKKNRWIRVSPEETTTYTVNGVSDNGCPFTISHTVVVTEGNSIEIVVKTDWYGSETSWNLKDSYGNIVASKAPYSYGNNKKYKTKLTCLTDECYTLEVYDSYGDGMCCTYGYGYYKVIDSDGNVLVNGGQFGNQITESFCIGDPAAMPLPYEDMFDEPSMYNAKTVPTKAVVSDLSAITVYPNPTIGELNINALESDYMVDRYEVMDVAGRMLISKSYDKPFKQEVLDISMFTEGNYFVKLYIGNQVKVVKIIKE